MTTKVRWGVLGTAHVNRRLIPAMRAARYSELVAIASRDPARATAYAHDWDIATAHLSYDALLRDRAVDAVYIPLPNALHVEWTLRALDAGKHVLCEKPLALVPEDVDRIAAVAQARGLVVAEAFMYRHEPLTAHVQAMVRNGIVGTPWLITAGFSYQQRRDADVRLDAALGGGSLWDIGCYAVNIARLLAGSEPISAFGVATPFRSSAERTSDGLGQPDAGETTEAVDDTFSGLLQFRGGLVASIHSSFRASYRTWLDVAGADGELRVANPFRPGPYEEIEIRREGDSTRVAVEGSPELFVRQVDDFVAAVLEGRPAAVSLADSRGNAAALAALHRSARTGRAVTI